MLPSFDAIGNTISAHPWLTLLLFLLTSGLVLHYFSDVALGSVIAGVFRLLGSIFAAPFHFIRLAVTGVAGFAADDAVDARSRTYLLHRSIEYSRLGALVGAILLVATGMTTAILGVWPSEQLAQRKALRQQIATADSIYEADSLRRAELTGSAQAEITRKREALRDSLQRRRTTIASSLAQFIDSVVALPYSVLPDDWEQVLGEKIASESGQASSDSLLIAKELLDRLNNGRPGGEVWNDSPYTYRASMDSAIVAAGPSIRRALKALAKSDTAWQAPQRGFLLALSAVETQVALVNALRFGSTEEEIEMITSRMTYTASERDGARQSLRDIKWFSGVKFFFLTVFYTFLLFVAFVWAVGLAIETTLLLIGIAQDTAAIRQQSRSDRS